MSTQPPARSSVRFILDGEPVELDAPSPTLTLLDYLREQRGRCGTREGCAEGDCGACTVVVGASGVDSEDALTWKPINACIRFVPTLDGTEVLTVEGLSPPQGPLHPVQQAMVDQHASQCGFCTSGFVMSLLALYLQHPGKALERTSVVRALAGNLCRCTGYRPIIDAALAMHSYPAPPDGEREANLSATRLQVLRSLNADQPLSIPAQAGEHAGYHAPLDEGALVGHLAAHPDALILAGGTDIGLWVTKQMRDLPPMVYIGAIETLKRIQITDGMLEIAAAVSLEDAWAALVAHYPSLAELAERFASPPIRHAGTLCGNLANGSPIGDAMPILIALGAQLELRRAASRRTLPLESLYLDYQKKALLPGEFLRAVRIPLPATQTDDRQSSVASYKISKRFEQDISAVCVGIVVETTGSRIDTARIAWGGMAPIPRRSPLAEAALIGQDWNSASFAVAANALLQDFRPLTDLRASAAYRLRSAGNLLQRFCLEYQPGASAPGKSVITRVHQILPA